jgi:hypothetical protein
MWRCAARQRPDSRPSPVTARRKGRFGTCGGRPAAAAFLTRCSTRRRSTWRQPPMCGGRSSAGRRGHGALSMRPGRSCSSPPWPTSGGRRSRVVAGRESDSASGCCWPKGLRSSSAAGAARRQVFRPNWATQSPSSSSSCDPEPRRPRFRSLRRSASPALRLWPCAHRVLGEVVGDTGLEPVTSCMSSKCSNQLS